MGELPVPRHPIHYASRRARLRTLTSRVPLAATGGATGATVNPNPTTHHLPLGAPVRVRTTAPSVRSYVCALSISASVLGCAAGGGGLRCSRLERQIRGRSGLVGRRARLRGRIGG